MKNHATGQKSGKSETDEQTGMLQGHPSMESFQMRPKCLKCVILFLESLFS